MLNWDKISCRKIPLNIGSLLQNLICTGNLSTLLQLLILNKAYYLEIKIGLINESHQISRPCTAILELFLNRKRENAGSLCIKHGTLSIVSHYITLHHIVSVNSICIYIPRGTFLKIWGEIGQKKLNLYPLVPITKTFKSEPNQKILLSQIIVSTNIAPGI